MHMSSSKMDAYKWCPRMYRLRYVEKIESYISTPLLIGNKTHKFIENFWKNCNFSLDTYVNDLNTYLKLVISKIYEKNYVVNATLQMYYSNFVNFQIRRIDKYIETYGNDEKLIKKLFYPIINEGRGKIKIANHFFWFVIDSVFWNPQGNILIDWKTDKECNETQFKSHKPQLNRYSVCLREVFKEICEKVGIFFVKDSLFFNTVVDRNYDLEIEVLNFIKLLLRSKYPKVDEKESYKCCSPNYECDYYPKICKGSVSNKK